MIGAVIKAPVSAQELQQRDASRRKKQISPRNYQQHSHKEQRYGLERILRGNGNIIAASHGAKSQKRKNSLRLRFLLPCPLSPEQLRRIRRAQLADGIAQNQGKYDQKQPYRTADRPFGQEKAHGDLSPHHPEKHQLIKDYSQPDSQAQADQSHIQGLPSQHKGNMLLLHSEHIEQTEFLFPAFPQKAVGI